VTSDAILGERSVWGDIEDEEELREALNNATALLQGQVVLTPEAVE